MGGCKDGDVKKNLAVIFGVTGNCAFALANVLIGLKRYSPDLADTIIVYHDALSECDQRVLHSIFPCEFRVYEPDEPLPVFRHSQMAYARLEGFKLLGEYRNVLWLDVDILIQRDISDILQYRTSGMAMRAEPNLTADLFFDIPQGDARFLEYDLTRKYFNSGVLLLSDRLRAPLEMCKWLYSFIYRYPELQKYSDQGAINLVAQEFDVEIVSLPAAYNNLICKDVRTDYQLLKNAAIVHSITSDKFWNFWRFPEWDSNYKQWLLWGGSAHGSSRMGFWEYHFGRLKIRYKFYKKSSRKYRYALFFWKKGRLG